MDGFFDVMGLFAQWAICAAINSSPLFLIVCVITLVGQRWRSARSRFALWSLVLIRMVMPFSLETSFGLGMLTTSLPANPSSPELVVDSIDRSLPDIQVPVNESLNSSDTVAAPTTSWMDYRWEYLVGVIAMVGMTGVSLLLAIWFLVTSLRTSHRIRQSAIPNNQTWNDLLKRGCDQFGIRVPVQLRMVSNWEAPATMGFFRPIIVLPEDAATLTETEVQHVVWHELAHIKRGDAAWSYLWIVARCLQWWNPGFWWTQHCWLAERELACDAMAMQHLGSAAGPDYGLTLLHFLERLSPSASVFQQIPLPGLVMLLGDKGTIRRRLIALAQPLAMETFWGRWGSLGLLTLLAVMGLTDAASSKTETFPLKSVTVPSETVWQFSPEPTDEVESIPLPTIMRAFDVSAALARIQHDEPNASAEIDIRQMIQNNRNLFPCVNGKPQTDQCQMQGIELIVRATESQHQRIQSLLNHWQRFGQQQICTEIRFFSTELELSDFMPGEGGQIISPSPFGDRNLLASSESTNEIKQLRSEPSYVQILTPEEATKMVQRLQEHPRSNVMLAPKVTSFSLISGYVADTIKRPFVTGLRTTNDGTKEPQVSIVTEGVQIGWTPSIDDTQGSVRLDLHLRLSRILDVETFRTKMVDQSDDICIQIPHVSEWNLKRNFTLTDGKGVLVSPLRRDKQGMLQLFLITPRIIEAR